ncbi:TPR domain-containing protein [Naegleria gruberi]|uniref:TPR domain-containing protein n=1 Tax=Naegleria gruberi TaxID=5762 RepID=D2VRQ8_NAEGR|nr:TPR domain-containing protein [Naegleria gruberi]EFC40434.1 TPR domain-containing protein [Naegleria gruberi]|eukprot:XP_002673178.1 TPR domain-containing protein [Naegleria gruberi strain NEG-M]
MAPKKKDSISKRKLSLPAASASPIASSSEGTLESPHSNTSDLSLTPHLNFRSLSIIENDDHQLVLESPMMNHNLNYEELISPSLNNISNTTNIVNIVNNTIVSTTTPITTSSTPTTTTTTITTTNISSTPNITTTPNLHISQIPSSLGELPTDIIYYVIGFLDLKDVLHFRLSFRLFHILAENEWQRFYKSVWQVAHRLVFWDFSDNHSNNNHFSKRGSIIDFSNKGIYSTHSILEYNNPWKDLFIERFRIIHENTSPSNKKKLGIFSPRNTSSEDYIEKGYRHVYRNEYTKAIQSFEKAISLDRGGSARAWEGLAKICWQRDLPQYVIVYAEEALKCKPVNPGELFFIRGKALMKLQRIGEALPDLTKAVSLLTMSPVNYHLFLKISEVYYERMICHLELGNIQQAFSDAETIITTDRCFETDCFFKAAKLLYEKQQFEDAEKFMKSQYVKKTPEFYLLYLQITSATGNYVESLKHLKSFEELEEKRKSNTFNYAPTKINKESNIDIGIVLLMNNCIHQAVEYFSKGALLRSGNHNETSPPTIGVNANSEDYMFSSLLRRSSLSFAFSPNKIIDEEATRRAKLKVIEASTRQTVEYSNYFGTSNISSCIDINMAWSFYYLLLALLYYCRNTVSFNISKNRWSSSSAAFSPRSTTSQLLSLEGEYAEATGSASRMILLIKSQKNHVYQQRKMSLRFINEYLENDLKNSITNLTRSITLNPTLCEGFYYRSLLKCFLQIDNYLVSICSSPLFGSSLTQTGIVSFLVEKFKKANTNTEAITSGFKKNHKKMHKDISDKINIVTSMRESLNDCDNAFTLITLEFKINGLDDMEEIEFKLNNDPSLLDISNKSKRHTELLIDILLLRTFLFYCFGKNAEALQCARVALSLCETAAKLFGYSSDQLNGVHNRHSSPILLHPSPKHSDAEAFLLNSSIERQSLACQGLLALLEDFTILKEKQPRFLNMKNDSIQRGVNQLIMNYLTDTEYSLISQELDFLLVMIHSQLLQTEENQYNFTQTQ